MIIVTGSIAYDYIMDFPGKYGDHILPDQIHKINLSFIVNKLEKRRGGTAGNTSYSLGLLKTPHILFSVAGKDFTDYKNELQKYNIDLSNVAIDNQNYTATGFAMTDNANNQIWGYFYGAAENISKLKLNKVATSKDLVLIGPSGARGSVSLIKQCIKLEIPYMFDPGFILTQVADKDLTQGVKNAALIVGNDYELEIIGKRVKNFPQVKKGKIVITTLGEKGAVIENKGKVIKIKPVKNCQLVDPTGAGDAFRSGFLAGFEKKINLEICGQMGAVAASFAIEHYGTQEHFFTIKEFTRRYRETYNKNLVL